MAKTATRKKAKKKAGKRQTRRAPVGNDPPLDDPFMDDPSDGFDDIEGETLTDEDAIEDEPRGADETIIPPKKGDPQYKDYQKIKAFEQWCAEELRFRKAEKLPSGITMAQTESRHELIHLLELSHKKAVKLLKCYSADSTPDLFPDASE